MLLVIKPMMTVVVTGGCSDDIITVGVWRSENYLADRK